MTSHIDRRKRSPAANLLRQEIKRDHFQNGVRVKDLAKKYGYSQSSISSILGNKRKLLRTKEINDNPRAVNNIYNNRTLIVEMEKQLFVWIKEKQEQNESVSQNSISQKALEIYDNLKAEIPKLFATLLDGFRASEGWFNRFTKRYEIDSIDSTRLVKGVDRKELTSASDEGSASTSDVDPIRLRGLVDGIEDSVSSSSKIMDTSNALYLQERNTKDSTHTLSNCPENINNNNNIKSEFDSSVNTECIENMTDNSILIRTVPPPTPIPPTPPPPLTTTTGAHLSNSEDKMSVKPLIAENRLEDEFDAFGKYVAMSLRNMPMSNALSVENQIYTAINNERRLILLQNNKSGINIGVEVKMEIQEEPI